MADKAISELIAAPSVTPDSLFVLQQDGTAKKLTAQVLENWLLSFAGGHGGIQSWVPLKKEGLVTTYRITLADQTHIDIDVVDGRGIESVKPTSTVGLVVTYTITYNDGNTDTITVTNGEKGDKGDRADIWVKYASQKPTASSHSFGDVPDSWIGIATGHNMDTAPTDWQQYTWFQWKGEKGDPGEPATLVSSQVTYQVGDSGTIIPSGSWSESIPPVPQGKYLWTKEVTQFNTGNPITKYSVSRFGIDGSGSVSTVAGVSPDADGNVPLTAASVNALGIGGGTMEGPVNMSGQKLSGLNAPTKDDEAATKGYTETYVNNAVKKAAPYNYAGNSDFTQWVAQPGLCKSHAGSVAIYAGDRWILDSGTVTGDAREDGNGYTNITLNGTIRQIVENAPDVGTPAIEMTSGTANISYANGEITITSNGGVIKNVRLFRGNYGTGNIHAYQPKGYGAELTECMRYYYEVMDKAIYIASVIVTGGRATWTYPLPVKMRTIPTICIKDNREGVLGKDRTAGIYFSGENMFHYDVGVGRIGSLDFIQFTFVDAARVGKAALARFSFAVSADFPED